MKYLYSFAIALLLLPCVVAAQDSPEDRYIAIYDLIQQADSLNDAANMREALPKYKEAQESLMKFQTEYPSWNTKIVKFRLNYLAAKINPLQDKSLAEVPAATANPVKPVMTPVPPANDQVTALQDQLRQAQLEKGDLEKQLKEMATNPPPSSTEAQAFAQAQAKIKALQQENDQLKSGLKSQGQVDSETALMARATQALADAKAKLTEQTKLVTTLSRQNETLQKRLEAVTADTTGSSQVAILQQQLRAAEADRIALQNQVKEAQAHTAVGLDQISTAEEKIKNLQKENNLLRASLERRPSQTISTADSFSSEQNKQTLAELNQKLQQQSEQMAVLFRDKEALQKRLDSVVNTDALARELTETKKELTDTKRALTKLQKRYDMQTEAAVVLITEYKIKTRLQAKAGESMMRQLEDLKKQKAGASETAELITTLRDENDLLRKQMAEIRERAASGGSTAESNTELLTVQTQLGALQAQLETLQAKPIPYTDEELKLFKTPEAPAPSSKKTSGKLPAGGAQLVTDAQRLFASHRLKEAEDKYQQVLKLDPNNVFILGNLATIQIEQENFEDAEKNLRRAMKLEPKDAFTLGVYGNMLFRLAKYDEAFEALSRAAQLDPNSAEIQNILGITLSHRGQRGPAETALRKALQLDPNYGNAHNNLAVIYITQEPPLKELASWHYQKGLSLGVARNPDLEKLLETTPPEEKK